MEVKDKMSIDKYVNKIIQGHVLSILKPLPNESIDMCLCSPPYWALRDYGTEAIVWDGDENCKHKWGEKLPEHHPGQVEQTKWNRVDASGKGQTAKSGQFCIKCNAWLGSLGIEPTFDLYIKHLCDIFDEVKRVLKKDGTCWVNIGDTYGGSWSNYGARNCHQRKRNTQKYIRHGEMPQDWKPPTVGLPKKSLVQIPARFSIEMCGRGWILRNEIIWHKRNCMPSSADDRFTVDYEKLFFFTKNPKYYFEQQFEKAEMNRWSGNKFKTNEAAIRVRDRNDMMPENRNKRCVWTINTNSYPEAHFAVYPKELCQTPIKAGCPKGGIVLDPFSGAGTTALVALKLGRKFIGIELNQEYIKIAENRIWQEKNQLKLF